MGCVTGKGIASLVRERFGIRLSTLAMGALLLIDAASEPFLPFLRPLVDVPRRLLISRLYLHALDD